MRSNLFSHNSPELHASSSYTLSNHVRTMENPHPIVTPPLCTHPFNKLQETI